MFLDRALHSWWFSHNPFRMTCVTTKQAHMLSKPPLVSLSFLISPNQIWDSHKQRSQTLWNPPLSAQDSCLPTFSVFFSAGSSWYQRRARREGKSDLLCTNLRSLYKLGMGDKSHTSWWGISSGIKGPSGRHSDTNHLTHLSSVNPRLTAKLCYAQSWTLLLPQGLGIRKWDCGEC